MHLVPQSRYPLRVEAMQLQLEFKEKMTELQPSISLLQEAMTELVECETLRDVFYITLLTGNIINGVRERGREGVREGGRLLHLSILHYGYPSPFLHPTSSPSLPPSLPPSLRAAELEMPMALPSVL